MIKQCISIFLILGCLSYNYAQKSINDYKYVVVPYKFDFVSGKDAYRLNTLTRHLFKSNQFDAYFDEQSLPKDLFEDRCLAMYADVIKLKSLLTTKVQIELKDCRGNLILVSDVGKSKQKEYAKGYNEAIRNAFESIAFLNYTYEPKENSIQKTETIVSKKDDDKLEELQQPKNQIETLKKEKEKLKVADSNIPLITIPKPQIGTVGNQNSKTLNNQLFAQPIANGFQLVDTTPKIVMKIYSTGIKDVFMVNDFQSIIYKKHGRWYIAKAVIDGVKEKELQLKF